MALSYFDDKAAPPTEADLAEALGRTSKLWNELKAYLRSHYDPLTGNWGFSGAKWGWSMRMIHKKRTVLYLTPCRRHFLVGLVLGERAVAAATKSDLPRDVLDTIEAAPKYAEGRGFRLQIRYKKDIAAVEKLAAIKMAR